MELISFLSLKIELGAAFISKYVLLILPFLDVYLAENPENIIIGEDIVDDPYNSGLTYGGSFKVTKGLSTLFPGQVLSAPISESGLTGFGTGLSLRNNTTVIEIMFADFLSQNIDQIFHQVSIVYRPIFHLNQQKIV